MVQIVLVGLAGGAAAALLLASIVSGSFVAVFLFYLAPMPILIAALGWGHLAGLIAAATATVAIAVVSGTFIFAVPVVAFGAWWLGYLTLLARASAAGDGTLEWYPVGRLVLWSAVIAAAVVAAVVPLFGSDQESLHAALRKGYENIISDKSAIDLLVVAMPPAAAVFSTILNLVNLWLAARVVRFSGRLTRPWPDLTALALPPASLGLLAAAVAGALAPDLVGILSGALAASLLMAFAILGFAVLHAITRGLTGRPAVLAGAYVATFVIGWPVVGAALLGFAETLFNIRERLAAKGRPPQLPA
jgi:hypothetical protein